MTIGNKRTIYVCIIVAPRVWSCCYRLMLAIICTPHIAHIVKNIEVKSNLSPTQSTLNILNMLVDSTAVLEAARKSVELHMLYV